MKINEKIIEKIFNQNIKLKKKEDKIKLSEYIDFIPMYDIYSEKVYPIKKENLLYRLIDCHYRFITNEVKKWIENKYNKNKKLKNNIFQNHKYNLEIIDNYQIEILIKTSFETLVKYSQNIGFSFSICKRNSFNKYIKHLNPYYTKEELIKLGLNMNIISKDKYKKLINKNKYFEDEKIHYDICKKISKNDISSEEIESHSRFIIENNLISLISNYSFMGSYFMNKFLRNNGDKKYNNDIINNINKLNEFLLKTPPLKNDYYLYRFIWNDDFLKNLKVGDIFTDKGFLSTTRDPFYSPALRLQFGLILIKIKIPKNKNIGLLIENFSLFPKEEEFLLPSNSRYKLISKDDNFKYFHTNKKFENIISKKYEFEYKDNIFKKLISSDTIYNYKQLNFTNIDQQSKINIIKNFLEDFKISDTKLAILKDTREYIINYYWFDGTDSYDKFYYNSNKDGITFLVYDENNFPYLSIEFGDEMVINFLNKFYFYNNKKSLDKIDLELIINFAYIFKYNNFKLFLEYNNFSEVNKINMEDSYLYNNLYNLSLYEYLKNSKKFYLNFSEYNKFFNLNDGYWTLDKLKKTKIPNELKNYIKNNSVKTISDLIINIIENHFYSYEKLIEILKELNILNDLYINFNTISYFNNNNIYFEKINLNYDNNIIKDEPNYQLVFDQKIKRIV